MIDRNTIFFTQVPEDPEQQRSVFSLKLRLHPQDDWVGGFLPERHQHPAIYVNQV